MARRRSGQNFQQLQNTRQYPGLSKQEVTDVMVQFKKAQQKPGSGLSLYDLVRLLRSTRTFYSDMQYEVDEQKKNHLNSQLQQKEIRVIDLNTTLYFAAQLKKEKEQSRYFSEDQNNEYIDAFVALGGSSDTTGYISKSNLMHILKSEFELAVDLQSLLNANGGAEIDDHLFFGQFKQLFDQEVQPTNRGSVLSLKEEKQPNFDKGPLNKKFVVRNTTSSLLLQPGSVIGVDGILINTSSDTRMYTAQTVTDVEVWRIDKRPLIVLISSFNLSDNQPIKLNEVNLVTQLGEVEFTNKQQELLQENVRRIQTSEKKIRDIKLKSMGTSSGLKRRANSQTNVRVNSRQREDLYNDLRETVKTAGIHKMPEYAGVEQLRNIQNTPKLVQTSEPVTERPAQGGTAYSWFSPVQQTINTILMAPDDSQMAPPLNNSRINRSSHAPRSISSKIIRNPSNASKHGKDQRQIILSHLEKKRNSQLKSKLISVHENKADQKQSELVRVKRMFQGHPKKSLPTTPKQKQIEDALLSKMCNMNDSPLLFHMQSLRKKLLEGNATPFLRKVKHKLIESGSMPPAHNTSQKENLSSKILIRDM